MIPDPTDGRTDGQDLFESVLKLKKLPRLFLFSFPYILFDCRRRRRRRCSAYCCWMTLTLASGTINPTDDSNCIGWDDFLVAHTTIIIIIKYLRWRRIRRQRRHSGHQQSDINIIAINMRIKQHQLGALFRSATRHDKALLFSTPSTILLIVK